MKKYQYLFGPVPSRRFGRSLGIDLTPFKTCSLDCVFCQLGRTTISTAEPQEFVSLPVVLSELDDWLKTDGKADVITFSGSGEPTLYARLGEIIDWLHQHTEIPILLLTNGSLLHLPAVREAAARADRVKISLSAWDQASFEAINRPNPTISFAQLIDGERRFCEAFTGQLFLEVFLLWGMNSSQAEVQKIAALAKQIRADHIHLNTAIRPPAEAFAVALPQEKMTAFCELFSPRAEVIAEFSATGVDFQANENTIAALLHRRPCTSAQIAAVFDMHPNEVAKYLGKLQGRHIIQATRHGKDIYYSRV